MIGLILNIRGHVKYSNLTVYNRPGLYYDLYSCKTGWEDSIGERHYVYSGPTTAYPQIGYVENETVRVLDRGWLENETECCFIEYSAGG